MLFVLIARHKRDAACWGQGEAGPPAKSRAPARWPQTQRTKAVPAPSRWHHGGECCKSKAAGRTAEDSRLGPSRADAGRRLGGGAGTPAQVRCSPAPGARAPPPPAAARRLAREAERGAAAEAVSP